jgi:hypothetical protein
MNYFIKIEEEEQGPFIADQIRRRLTEKGYQPSDLVRRDDATEWVILSSLEEFRDATQEQDPLPNPMAATSLGLGIAALLQLLLFSLIEAPWFWLTGLAAIIVGHLALRKIHCSPQQVSGYRLALWGRRIGYSVVIFIPALSLLMPVRSHVSEKGIQTKAINNCRQILTTLKIYASENSGAYPDSETLKTMSSNEAYRLLFQSGILNSESIFGCPSSNDGNPDGIIGTSPDFREASKPGENHWALTKGLSDSVDGSLPVVFEAPAIATWPPRWLFRRTESKDFGRTWPKGKIVIGTNDSSVALLPTEAKAGGFAELAPSPGGVQLFQTTADNKHEILNVAR